MNIKILLHFNRDVIDALHKLHYNNPVNERERNQNQSKEKLEGKKMELMKKQTVTGSQKLMIFVLTMALYGLATLFTELIPSFQAGVVEF